MRLLLLLAVLPGCSGDVSVAKHDVDLDGDGYLAEVDCDDARASVHPEAEETCDGVDQDCDGEVDEDPVDGVAWYADGDADGYGAGAASSGCVAPEGTSTVATDCEDGDGAIHPGAEETCDGVDEDCDGETDEDAVDALAWYPDADGDGYGDVEGAPTLACDDPGTGVLDASDCDDTRDDTHPEAPETDCTDPHDYDCDGSSPFVDDDGDGAAACVDCDDADASVTDERLFGRDRDGDGYGDAATTTTACAAPEGYVADLTDCDDYDADANPGRAEVCDDRDVDEDCDGLADDADASTDPATWTAWHRDLDGDTYGDAGHVVTQCEEPAGYVADGADCDDGDGAVNPGAAERCDAWDVDEDCDGLADDADGSAEGTTAWYADRDADGHGAGAATAACDAPSGRVASADDCDDTRASVSPDAAEVCDGVDDDCDALVDDDDPDVTGTTAWYTDGDADRYGAGTSVSACSAPAGRVATGGDCDDGDASISPAGIELCDGVDDDCDGLVDDDDPGVTGTTAWYTDGDGDGYGAGAAASACSPPAGRVASGGDCDDSDAAMSPDGLEVCDGVDDDCDGLVDDADGDVTGGATWHPDADGDGYGATASSRTACARPGGYVADGTDCDDGASAISPSGAEICDGVDDDCDGLVDDADPGVSGTLTWYTDADADGYGDASSPVLACDAPAGAGADGADCDDADPDVSPAGREVCGDGIDQDCDGEADEGCLIAGELTDPDAIVRIRGSSTIRLGTDICPVGDTNGDGHDDLLLVTRGASVTGTDQGAAMLFRGPLSGNTSVASATATLTGQNAYDALDQCSPVGDVDGDGYDDLFVSSWTSDPTGHTNEGGAWLVFPPVSGTFSLTGADVEIDGGADAAYAATHPRGLGDVNDDGLADFAVNGSNAVHIFYGPGTGTHVIGSANVNVTGASGAGVSDVIGAGDLDGDGVDDFLFGVSGDDTAGADAGALYVVLGAPVSGTIASQADRAYTGEAASQYVGISVSAPGDLDGDGYADLAATTNLSTALFLYGPLPASGSLATLSEATVGLYVWDPTGYPRGAGDLDGDGDDEVLISDPNNTTVAGTGRGLVGIFDAPLGTLGAEEAETWIVGDTDGDDVWVGTSAGDIDGDGLLDVAVMVSGDDGGGSNYGATWIFSPR